MKRVAFFLVALSSVLLTVQGASAAGGLPLRASPSHVNFGPFPINSGFTPTQTVTFTNVSNNTVQTADFDCSGDCGQFGVINDNCSFSSIQPGHTCTMDTEFGPGSTGHLTATIFPRDASLNHLGKVTLSGRGTP